MSHIVTGSKVTNLTALSRAAVSLGLQVHSGETYRVWQGARIQLPGYESVPSGGGAVLVITRPGSRYEIGVVPARDAAGKLLRDEYLLVADSFVESSMNGAVGNCLMEEGQEVYLPKLRQRYALEVDRMAAEAAGDTISFQENRDGSIEARITVNPERLAALYA